MDNFRRYRPRTGPESTDGFVNARHIKGSHASRGTVHQPTARKVGDFKAPDGFRPATRNQQAAPQSNPLHVVPPSARHERHKSHRHTKGDPAGRKRKLRFLPQPFNPFKRNNWTKKRVACAVVSFVVLIGSGLGLQAYLTARRIFRGGGDAAALQEGVDPSRLRGEGDGRVNILLLGRGGAGHEGADLTDTILVASINPIQKDAALLSIPRDLYVSTGSGYSKINAVFANAKNNYLYSANSNDKHRVQKAEEAGFKAVEDIVRTKIGLPVHYHGMIDFEGFKKAINTVGGVDLNVPANGVVYENLWLQGRNYELNVQRGPQHFDGMRALAYARSRYTSARGDFDRAERQRLLLVALKNKVVSAGTYANPLKVSQLMKDFGGHIQANMSLGEVMRLYEIGKDIDSGKIASVGLADPPNNFVTTDNVNGLSVVVPRAGLDDYSAIQHFVRNRLRDGFLASENASVMVVNGTSISGLASRTATDLRSYGYNVTQIGDAPTKNYQQTVLVDMRSGAKKYTRRYLENRFKLTAKTTLPDTKITPGTADFVIILGQNEQNRLAN